MLEKTLAAMPAGHVLGMGRIARAISLGEDLNPVWRILTERLAANPEDADALFDLAMILRFTGQVEKGDELQAEAQRHQPTFTCRHGKGDGLKLLVFVTGIDVMASAPVDMLLEGSNVTAHYFHVDAVRDGEIPDHDVAFLAIGESQANRPYLEVMKALLPVWPRPAMNAQPERILAMTRDEVSAALASEASVACPPTAKRTRWELQGVASGAAELASLLPEHPAYPIIVRPVNTDRGEGLERVYSNADLADFLERYSAEQFHVAPFVDYSRDDGLFRKYRVTFIDGRTFPAHLAVSSHWIVHYISAGMADSTEKRAEEELWMRDYDADFAVRHAAAFAAIQQQVGTDYFSIDCAETRDGRLLFFEADVASIVHALDCETTFPYKKPAMAKVFSAFTAALQQRRSAVLEEAA